MHSLKSSIRGDFFQEPSYLWKCQNKLEVMVLGIRMWHTYTIHNFAAAHVPSLAFVLECLKQSKEPCVDCLL